MEKLKKETNDGKVIMVDMRHYILSVATSLMTKNGIKETSLKDIAKEAGISKGTLYYHYSSKDDLIYDIAETNLSEITNEVLNILENSSGSIDVKQILKTLFEKILAQDTRGKLHLYLVNNIATNEALKDKFFKRYDSWKQLIQNSLNKTMGEDNCSKMLPTLILAVIDGLLIQRQCGHDAYSIDEIIHLLFPNT